MGSADKSEVGVVNMKIEFHYNSEVVDLSDNDGIEINCGVAAFGFKDGWLLHKATDARKIKIANPVGVEIPENQQGDLYIYKDIDSGSIWQAICDGKESGEKQGEVVYMFSAKAA